MTLASFYDSHRIKRVTLETMTDPLSKALRRFPTFTAMRIFLSNNDSPAFQGINIDLLIETLFHAETKSKSGS